MILPRKASGQPTHLSVDLGDPPTVTTVAFVVAALCGGEWWTAKILGA